MKKFLAALLCMLFAFGNAASHAGPLDPLKLDQIVTDMSYPGVVVSVEWQDCGVVNAYYQPMTREITLCYELLAKGPSLVRYALAHEIAHAIIDQLDIPFTGLEETAADELAAYVFTITDRQDDLLNASKFWATMADRLEDPEDPHPSPARRSVTLACLANGSTGDDLSCIKEWRRVIKSWNVLLKVPTE